MSNSEVVAEVFASEPRILSHEVAKMREALVRLCDLMGELELDRKVTSVIESKSPIAGV
jgi:hypothetical protein